MPVEPLFLLGLLFSSFKLLTLLRHHLPPGHLPVCHGLLEPQHIGHIWVSYRITSGLVPLHVGEIGGPVPGQQGTEEAAVNAC